MTKTAAEFESIQETLRAVTGPKNCSKHTVKEWAHLLGHAESTMYAKGKEVSFTLDDLVTVTALGEHLPLEYLADVGGAVVFYRPKETDDCPVSLQAAASLRDFGEYLKELSNAQDPTSEGGVKITPRESAKVQGRINKAIAGLATLNMQLQQIIDEEKK